MVKRVRRSILVSSPSADSSPKGGRPRARTVVIGDLVSRGRSSTDGATLNERGRPRPRHGSAVTQRSRGGQTDQSRGRATVVVAGQSPRVEVETDGRSDLSLAYAEALTARFLKAPEARNARLNGLVVLGVVDYLLGVRGVRPPTARVEDVWAFLFEELPRVGWISVAEIPSALAELRAFWRFLSRAADASRRVALQGFLSRRSTAKALAERLKACVDDTVDLAPF